MSLFHTFSSYVNSHAITGADHEIAKKGWVVLRLESWAEKEGGGGGGVESFLAFDHRRSEAINSWACCCRHDGGSGYSKKGVHKVPYFAAAFLMEHRWLEV